eukprot:TRINITY_DN13526_c0_g1_i9.p1 TRINITY_DN13526_c0_g1~~TRINITY_DN13526_c0_g1_i9.p1  ORF type:complete len:161 (+),score=36.77 TRINITY_DN13526_c0_g1_i9:130-612(+)
MCIRDRYQRRVRGGRLCAMNFCRECNNMLYPRENKEEKKLYMTCKNCGDETPAEEMRVYRNEIKRSADNSVAPPHAVRDLPKDPALPHSCSALKKCPLCDCHNTVYFTASGAAREQSMALYFVCANPTCAHMWKDVHESTGKEFQRRSNDEVFNIGDDMN